MLLNDHNTVLITGGCGAIGSCIVNYFKKTYANTRFINLDAITYAANSENIELPHDNYELYKGDICNVDFVMHILQKEKPSLVIHLAAETHVDQSFCNSLNFTKTNVVGTHTLLECVKNTDCVKLFIHMSTDEVYGSINDDEICSENAMLAPTNPYAASKAGAEMICHAFIKSFKLPIIIVRCNNAISPYQHNEKLVPQCIDSIINNRKICIHGDGSAKRTFIHGIDIAKAFDCIINNGSIGNTYNIGSKLEYTVLDVVHELVKQMRPEDNYMDWIKFVPDRAFQDLRYNIDSTELYKLGWTDKISFKDAIKNVIDYKTQ